MKRIILSLSVIAMIAFTSCKNNESKDKEETATEQEDATMEEKSSEDNMSEGQTIVEIASGNDDFSTLVTALKAAELVETLNGEGPFTVFAPTNAAFSKLPEGTVPSLLKEENKDKLSGILTYHVVSGEFMASDVMNAINENNGSFVIPTVQGGELVATLEGENCILTDVKGNTATVIMTDVDASNGVVHAIDTVLMPK